MNTLHKKIMLIIIVIFCFFNFTVLASTSTDLDTIEDAKEKRARVLFLNSYSPNFFAYRQRIDNFKEVLPDADIDVEFMDSKRFNDENNLGYFHLLLKYKIRNLEKYDVVVPVDDNAYQFAVKFQYELFKDIPIVFYGVNNTRLALESDLNPYITGVVEKTSLVDTIDAAIKMMPDAKEVIAITDGTNTCKPYKEEFLNLKSIFPSKSFREMSLENYSYEDYFDELAKLDKNTILLLVSAFKDKDGLTLEYNEHVRRLVESSPAPIFSLWEDGLEYGIFGGKVISHKEQSRLAALLVKDILNGRDIKTMKVVSESPNRYMFNKDLLNTYNVDKSLIPPNSILISSEEENLKFYKKSMYALTILLSCSILFMLFQQRVSSKRKRVQNMLQEKNDELTGLYEELYASEAEITAQFNKLNESHRKYELILNTSHNALLDIDFDKKTLTVSPNFKLVVGNDLIYNELMLKNFASLVAFVHQDDKQKVLSVVNVIENKDVNELNVDIRIKQNNNEYKWFNIFGRVLRGDNNNAPTIMAVSISDIHQEKLSADQNKKLAYYDTLTGLPNRSLLYKKISKRLDNNEFKEGVTLFIDIDNFKFINDTYGHEFGDRVLKIIGDRLKIYNSENCIVSRIGGDEFILFIIGNKDEAIAMIEDIYREFKHPIYIDGKNMYANISLGASLYPYDGDTLDSLFMCADLAMYKAKALGKDTYVFFEESMKEEMQTKTVLHNELRNAIKNNELSLYYQPKYDISNNEVTSYEALLRWNNKNFGFISPAKFIPLAEETGLILDISKWVLSQACEFIKKTGVRVSVNVSPVELTNISYLENVKSIIKEVDIDPSLLGLEVTENALVENFNLVVEILQGLMNCGIKVYLDDFGKGYSSLNYLRRLPIDYLKIDKSFVDDIVEDSQAKFIIDAIIRIAHNLNLNVIAEGVETNDQLNTLRDLGCDQIQGYLMSRPIPEKDLIDDIYIA